MKIEYHVEDFIDYCVEKGLSRKTYSSYEQTLRLFAKYLQEEKNVTEVARVNQEMIRDYIKYIRQRGKYTAYANEKSKAANFPDKRKDYGKKVSDVTINNYVRNIKVFFNYLVDQREIRRSPAEKIKQIKVVRKPLYYMNDLEYHQLMNAFNLSKLHEYRDYVIINTMLDTGMRVGECLAMEVINFETNLRKYTARAELKNIHPHVFRNNFAKRFLINGGDIYTLSRILGHSSVEVTEKAYMDLDVSDLKHMYESYSPLSNMRRY